MSATSTGVAMELEPKYLHWCTGRWMRTGNFKVVLYEELISSIRCWFVGLFTVCLAGTVWLIHQETSEPELMGLPWLESFPHGKIAAAAAGNRSDEPVIRATYIRGKEAVEQFRNHLACFSESGRWLYDPTPRHLPWNYVGDTFACKCDGMHQWKGRGHVHSEQAEVIAADGNVSAWLVREELKWVWRTNSSCPFWPVNRDDFCRRIGPRRNVMVVGDSLNHEISWSLMNHLMLNRTGYSRLSTNNRSTDGVYEMCGDIFGAGNGFKISFVRNDRLSPIQRARVDRTGNFYEFPWLNLLHEYDVKLVLMNRGAHYEDDEIYSEALRRIFTILSDQFPHLRVIYRNTPPGHVNCETFHGPLFGRQKVSELADHERFHWADFYRQNQLAAKIVEEFHYLYMDIDTMLSLRADGHLDKNDCLHYCLPGPLDLSIQYLYNILLLL